MRHIPRFYLDESILDDLMSDPEYAESAPTASQQIAAGTSTSSTDNADYAHTFKFKISSLPKNRPSDWYLTRLKTFRDDFEDMLDKCRHIRDFNHRIVFWMPAYRRENDTPYAEFEEDGLYFIIHEDEDVRFRLTGEAERNDIYIEVGMDVSIDSVFQLRKIMLSLYRIFQNAVKLNFRSQATPYCVVYVKKEQSQFGCDIKQSDIKDWTDLPVSFDRTLKNMYRAVHPEVKPKDIQKQLDEWRDAKMNSDDFKGDRRAIELLKNLGLYYGNEVVTFDESDKTVLVKVRGDRKWEPTKLDKLLDFINNYEYVITITGICRLHIGFNYVETRLDDVYRLLDCLDQDYTKKRILVQIQNSMQLMQKYDGKTIDLTKMFPGYKVTATFINADPKTVIKNIQDYDLYPYSFDVVTCEQRWNSVQRKWNTGSHKEHYKAIAFKKK